MNTIEAALDMLEMRHDRLRLREAGAEKALLVSLSEVGQQTPVMAVRDGSRYVVIDGHKRVRALKKLKSSHVKLTVWDVPEADALAMTYGMNAGHPRCALEEGWLIETLHHRFDWTLGEIGRKLARSASWVSRRLALVEEIPGYLSERIQEGRIGAHAAAHYLLPLTRGNGPQANDLLEKLTSQDLTDRQIKTVAEAYFRSTAEVRRKITADPALFLKAHAAHKASAALTDIENRCVKNLTVLGNISLGLAKHLPEALPSESMGAGRKAIEAAWVVCEERWAMLQKTAAMVIRAGEPRAG
jgi:ParB/RepB/Spo0J family partition protein